MTTETAELVEKLRSPWHHGECKQAADVIVRLNAELAAEREHMAEIEARMMELSALVPKAEAQERDRREKLQQAWEDLRTQRDELLAHIAGKAPLPQWAADWIKA